MLDAADIILISIGCLLLFITIVAILLASITFRRRIQEEEKHAAEVQRKITRELYLDQPLSTTFNSGKPNFTSLVVNEEHPDLLSTTDVKKNSFGKNTKIVVTNETLSSRSSSKSLKRPSRPVELCLTSTGTVAEKANAINTRHSISSFRAVFDDYRYTVLRDEFQILESRDAVRVKSCQIAEQFREKNRFGDILPYDDNRVILSDGSYINASFIDGYRQYHQFIATQGPMSTDELGRRKEDTVDDFWRMVWETNGSCVIMLTDCVENMQTKCSRYWPVELGLSEVYGSCRVSLMAESVDPICDQRELDVVCNDESRQVSQFHFRDWRDSEAANPTRLLDFIERIMNKRFNGPIIVHCSAGVGRTGVFIATWRLLERARHERGIDVFNEVFAMRDQRGRMVQSAEQYHNIYEAISTAIMEQRI
ncbi:unnamed protein product [Auanema sp. JU1783]|nr:unnamed protein product [Auanema sp. JU1783]